MKVLSAVEIQWGGSKQVDLGGLTTSKSAP